MRYNLQPAGMPPALFLGQGVHIALDHYYRQDAPRSMDEPIQVFKDWCKDRAAKIEERTGRLWEQERDMINEMYALGHVMLEHYGLWIPERDKDLEVLGTEYKFKHPVPAPAGYTGRRGQRMVLAGRFDGVVRERSTGDVYLLEFKTTSRLSNARWTMRSLQSSSYAWAATQIYGDIKGVIYRFLVKKAPRQLKWLQKSGRFSMAVSQKTSYEWARKNIEDAGEDPKDYKEFLLALHQGGSDYFKEYRVPRTEQQKQDAIDAVYSYGRMMVDPDVPIFASGGFHCGYCPFVDPCTMRERGIDPEPLLAAEYESRDYWESEAEDET
jgi:hypothetical protein